MTTLSPAVPGGSRPPRPTGAPTRPNPAVRSIAIGRQRLRVAVRPGDGSRTPLLMINGIGASLELLKPVVDALDPALEVIRFDPPGVGGSPAPNLPYNFFRLSLMVGRMMKVLGHQRFDVLGISWGGGVAQQVAVQMANRVRRVVLVSTGTGSLMVPAHPQVLMRMVTPRRYLNAGYAESIAPLLYGGTTRTNPELARMLHNRTRMGDQLGYFYQLMAGCGWSSLPFLPLLRAPTLILTGDDDPLIPLVNGRVMNRLIPHSTLHVYHGGHLALVTEAPMLAPVIESFLDA